MKIFKSIMFTWWQVGLLKLCVLAFGLVVGALWSVFFMKLVTPLVIIFVGLGAYLTIVWLKQVK